MSPTEYRTRGRYPILSVGLSMVAFILIKTARDAAFFQWDGLRDLPMAYMWIAAASLPAAWLHLRAMARCGSRGTRTCIFFVAAAVFAVFIPFVGPDQRVAMTVLFVVVPTVFAAVFAGAWLLAGDLLEGAEWDTMRKVYSRIGAGSMVGGIIGGLMAKGLSRWLEPSGLVAAGAGILVVVGAMTSRVHRRYETCGTGMPEDGAKRRPSPFARMSEHSGLLKQEYVITMMAISGLAAAAALFIDFQFYATATASGKSNAQFFADFYILLNAASLFLQLVVTPLLQARLGVGGTLLLFPSVLLGAAGVLSFMPSVTTRSAMRITEGGLKASIHRSTWEQAYLPIGQELRGPAKAVVDGAFARLSEGACALVLYVWVTGSVSSLSEMDLTWISWAIVGAISLWIVATRHLRRIGCGDVSPDDAVIRLPDSCPCTSSLGR
jgi:hypothetical protein